MKLFFHGRKLLKGEVFICEKCKVRHDFSNVRHRDQNVYSATLVQFSQGGRQMHTALIRRCADCKEGDKVNVYIDGWQAAPDCGGECCGGRTERSIELRARAQEVRLRATGGPSRERAGSLPVDGLAGRQMPYEERA